MRHSTVLRFPIHPASFFLLSLPERRRPLSQRGRSLDSIIHDVEDTLDRVGCSQGNKAVRILV